MFMYSKISLICVSSETALFVNNFLEYNLYKVLELDIVHFGESTERLNISKVSSF